MENINQKVYINPNFNRTVAHFNKHFSHTANNLVQQNKRKIFVNPNFLPMKESHNINFQSVQTIKLEHNANNYYHCSQNNPLPSGLTVHNMQSNSLIPYNMQSNSLTPHNMQSNSLTSYNMQSNSLTPYDMQSNSLTPHNMQSNSLTPHNMQSNNLTLSKTQSLSIPISLKKTQEQCRSYECSEQNKLMHQDIHNKNNYIEPTMVKSRYRLVRNTNLVEIPIKQEVKPEISRETQKEICITCNTVPTNLVAEKKSRYCIIRNNTNVIPNNRNIMQSNTNIIQNDENTSLKSKPVKNYTVKISKYKTITISNLKKELQTVKDTKNKFSYQPVKPRILSIKNKLLNSSLLKVSPKQSKYKYKNIEANHKKIRIDVKAVRLSFAMNRSTSFKQSKNKTLIGKYKINNIPCPLYVKYGKCLRKLNGSCEYLHDKKHVSLCRKFIKGLCHDTNCLLSHELSAKKMPTCYFYLKGMCTKENCPYLHVKLSSRSKICRDFLKGYCEKGEKCLERHVLQPTPSKVKRIQKDKATRLSPKIVQKLKSSPKIVKLKVRKEDNSNCQQNESDQRYFKDVVNNDEKCETIKPIRCKLGDLPSYIQLL